MQKLCAVDRLGCASCAAKMERQIARLPGVTACSLNFLTGRLRLEADEQQIDGILKEAGRIIRRIEPDARLRP